MWHCIFVAFVTLCSALGLNGLKVKKSQEQIDDLIRQVDSIETFHRLFNIIYTGRIRNQRNNKRTAPSELFANAPSSSPLQSGKQPACKPRLGLYTIPNVVGMLMVPRCLHNVSRCGGCCTDPWKECVVDKQTNKSVSVYIFKRSDPAKTFRNQTVYYTDHDTCKCQCKLRPSDCMPNQSHNEQSCECECNHKMNVTCSSLHTWSKTRCMCICSDKALCTNGMKRDDTTCLCTQQKYVVH